MYLWFAGYDKSDLLLVFVTGDLSADLLIINDLRRPKIYANFQKSLFETFCKLFENFVNKFPYFILKYSTSIHQKVFEKFIGKSFQNLIASNIDVLRNSVVLLQVLKKKLCTVLPMSTFFLSYYISSSRIKHSSHWTIHLNLVVYSTSF